jgi:hypothetical protein
VRIGIDRHWRIDARSELAVPLPAAVVWGQMRDWRRFLTLDPLHAAVRVTRAGDAPPVGTEFELPHQLGPVTIRRRGRMLRWREGEGYVISDMSMRRGRVGFPHVCSYRVEEAGESECRVYFGARGVWTARWLPRWAVKCWIGWVLGATEARVKAEFAALIAWRERGC